MEEPKLLVAQGWTDYELLDSGEGVKLERWGQYVSVRPEPRAIWNKSTPEEWKKADAEYGGEEWKFRSSPPEDWVIGYGQMKFRLKPTDFKHTGVFPEQAVNWEWIKEQIISHESRSPNPKILNLFAYTGGATMAAAMAEAHVTHVDASRPVMMWASENCRLAGVAKEKLRWIQDDALKFVQREGLRNEKYDGIIMDPPRFGRGASGEVWKLEDHLPKLVWAAKKILSPAPLFFLINAYTADLSSVALGNLLGDALGNTGRVECGELGLKESLGGRILPAGIFARWSLPS